MKTWTVFLSIGFISLMVRAESHEPIECFFYQKKHGKVSLLSHVSEVTSVVVDLKVFVICEILRYSPAG